MSLSSVFCTRCQLSLPAGTTRCNQCLRESTLVDGQKRKVVERERAGFDVRGDDAPPMGPLFLGTRIVITLLAYAAFAPILWLLLGHEKWLEEQGLWPSACLSVMVLGAMPLRMAFAPPDPKGTFTGPREEYGLRMVWVVAMAVGMAIGIYIAGKITSNVIASIFLGLFFCLAVGIGGSALVQSRRRGEPLKMGLLHAGKGIGISAALLIALILAFLLKSSRYKEPPRIVVVDDPKALLDPLSVEGVEVKRIWSGPESTSTLDLWADGDDFQRTFLALEGAAASSIDETAARPGATGVIRIWIPKRLDTPQNQEEAKTELRVVNDALASANKKATGGPIRVEVRFGRTPR